MYLSDFITIVIPCKNEEDIILKTLDLLNYQINIHNVNVIVCDSSTDLKTKVLLINRSKSKLDKFNLLVVDGGLPSFARNNGFKYVKTKYVLFIDADVFLLNPKVLLRSLLMIENNNLNLVTTKFRSDSGEYNYVYKVFDIIQFLSKWLTPFCLGGYMLVRSETFKSIGGFDEEIIVAEDYLFSKQIKPKKFGRLKDIVYTPPRRFKNKGVMYMLKLMIFSFFNKNNKSFFKKDNGYWT